MPDRDKEQTTETPRGNSGKQQARNGLHKSKHATDFTKATSQRKVLQKQRLKEGGVQRVWIHPWDPPTAHGGERS